MSPCKQRSLMVIAGGWECSGGGVLPFLGVFLELNNAEQFLILLNEDCELFINLNKTTLIYKSESIQIRI